MRSLTILAMAVGLCACGGSSNNDNDAAVSGDMAVSGGDMAGGGVPTCSAYCTTLLTNCTGAPMSADGGTVGLAPFSSMTACMNACAKYTVGTLADTSGATLGCRLYHAHAAGGSAANAALHCPHASMSGGGMCGDRCANFCALATSICTTADGVATPPFSGLSDCMSKCGTAPYAFDTSEPEIVVDTPTLNCAFYHLGEAFANPYNTDMGTASDHCGDFTPSNPDRGCQ